MDIASAVTIGKKALKMAKKAKRYFDLDQNKRIVILQSFVAGRFKSPVPDFYCEDFCIVNNLLTVYATGDREPICDGASLAPDKVAGFDIIASSVVHDCLYHYLEPIAHAWGWYVADVRKRADEAFGCDMLARARAEKHSLKRIAYIATAHIYYAAVRLFGGLYHKAKNGSMAIVAFALFCGCSIPESFIPTGDELHYIATNIVERIEITPEAEKPLEVPQEAVKPVSVDAVDYATLKWCYGGFNGSKAVLIDGVRIADLRVNGSGMSYKWTQGNCEKLGASGHTNADCIAALFCLVDGEWRGGKFEWISTSRTTRSWHNLHGYNGWRYNDYEAAKEVCFVIVSKDGRTRSNVIKAVK